MWREGVEQGTNMMAMNPYPGFKGEFFEMPCRNIVPKPVQKPHPPMWVACSNRETIKIAARCGIGALTFAFVDPARPGNGSTTTIASSRRSACRSAMRSMPMLRW